MEGIKQISDSLESFRWTFFMSGLIGTVIIWYQLSSLNSNMNELRKEKKTYREAKLTLLARAEDIKYKKGNEVKNPFI